MIQQTLRFTLPAAAALLPPAMMRTPHAWAMLLAIGLQESKFLERRQIVDAKKRTFGPARGFWQFERNGATAGVLHHNRTREFALRVLRELRYPQGHTPREVHYLLHDNDVLAACFARLLLWTLPDKLPARNNPLEGWRQYMEAWRPGDPHPSTWAGYYAEAWDRVEDGWFAITRQAEVPAEWFRGE
jgi:hypothetical protein